MMIVRITTSIGGKLVLTVALVVLLALGLLLGLLHLSVSTAEEGALLASMRGRLLLFIVLVTLVVAVVLYVLMTRLVVRPLRQLVAGTRRLAAGDLEHRVPVASTDEIGQLARSFNDTTEQLAQAQRRLFEAEKLASIGRLAAGVAHEINNPLTAILTYASAIRDEIPEGDPSSHHADLEAIMGETMRCRDIVRRLLDFARQRPLQRRPTNLNNLCDRAAQLLERQASFQRILIVRRFDPDLPMVDLDANQIHQVLVNLILNAHDAMPGGGEITIETGLNERGRNAILRVKDTGHGIPAAVRARLFEPFFTTRERGTGLGLAMSWGIIQRHSGTVSVESESGKGTTFTIELPLTGDSPGEGEILGEKSGRVRVS